MSKKILANKQQNEKVKKDVVELLEEKERFKYLKEKYEKKIENLQKNIRNYMFVNGVKTFSFLAQDGKFTNGNKNLKVTSVNQTKVIFDIEKIEKKFDKDILKEIVQKEYKINDYQGLVKYLKSCGVNPKKFLSFIDVEKKIDSKRLDELGELGEISKSDLKGCYEIKENVGFIRITEQEE